MCVGGYSKGRKEGGEGAEGGGKNEGERKRGKNH